VWMQKRHFPGLRHTSIKRAMKHTAKAALVRQLGRIKPIFLFLFGEEELCGNTAGLHCLCRGEPQRAQDSVPFGRDPWGTEANPRGPVGKKSGFPSVIQVRGKVHQGGRASRRPVRCEYSIVDCRSWRSSPADHGTEISVWQPSTIRSGGRRNHTNRRTKPRDRADMNPRTPTFARFFCERLGEQKSRVDRRSRRSS
jgi:hypothetical protein